MVTDDQIAVVGVNDIPRVGDENTNCDSLSFGAGGNKSAVVTIIGKLTVVTTPLNAPSSIADANRSSGIAASVRGCWS
jgi:hypothetical protein